MLYHYIGECMVSKLNINNDIKGPTRGRQNYNIESNVDIWRVSQGE